MTFEDIWNQLCRKQPAITKDGASVEFKSENLRALLRQVYEQGQKSATRSQSSGTMDAFKSIFGGH